MQYINDETLHDNPFELLDEDIVEACLTLFNLIDEENDDEELEIL